MKIKCVWEHNGDDSLLYAVDFPGAYARGASRMEAEAKMISEMKSYLKWTGKNPPELMIPEIIYNQPSDLEIRDADSDVLFEEEKAPLNMTEYDYLKSLTLKSAQDFQTLFDSVPDIRKSCLSSRRTFYGQVPRTAEEMYVHTKNVNAYYFGEIEVDADNTGSILECRRNGFAQLETHPDFLSNRVFEGSYGEKWTLRKVFRRFIWHDRIHGRAMYRMAVRTFGGENVENTFEFER